MWMRRWWSAVTSEAAQINAATLHRQLVRQALVGLGQVPPTIGAFTAATAALDATDAHVRHTARNSAVLRATYTAAELAGAADVVAGDAREVVLGVRWAPAAIDQLSYVLLRLLHTYEAIVRGLVGEGQPQPAPTGEHLIHVAGER
jgi:hypothetical protein